MVYDKGTYRNITYRDIVILLRTTTNIAPIYEKEMLEAGFPVFCDTTAEYLNSTEIQTIMSVLKILDNPMQDIPLICVLRSPIGNFTDNELLEIRLQDRKSNFYIAMQKEANMSKKEEMVAMILAGGRGTRLKSLTRDLAKPAVFFGGKYRIIDFPLSNAANSGIHSVGILTQYESTALNNYIGSGRNWGLNGTDALASILPPRETPSGANWYSGTADAIYQNIDWLDKRHCEYVVILSGDHIYKMDYSEMLRFHKENDADVTIDGRSPSFRHCRR